MKIWTCGSSPQSGSRNAWTRIKKVNGASRLSNFWNIFGRDPNDFLSRLVTMNETWLYHDPETKQQSIEWWHTGSPRPKKFRVQKSAGKVLASIRFFGIKTVSSSLIIFHKAKLWTRSITHLYWCIWRTFWRKNAAGSSPRGSCTCTTVPRLTGQLQPRKNWPSSVLITHPILRIWPRRTTTCSLDWKITIERSPFFVLRGHCCRGDLVGRKIFWIFLSGLQNLEQRAKQCIDLLGEYVA